MPMCRLRRSPVLILVAAVVLARCEGEQPFAPQETTVLISATSLTFSAIGATQPLTAAVLDQRGDTMPGATITWSSNNTAVATVIPSPATAVVVTAAGNGSTQIVATSGTLTGQATVTVAQLTAQLVKVSGDAQTDTVGQQLPNPLVVQANDANGNPVPGVSVSFQVTQGGGSLSALSGPTIASGRTQARWSIGTTAGAPQAVTATAATGSAMPVTFDATAVSGPSPTVVLSAGNNQTGLAGFALNGSPAVLVRDAADVPMPNVRVDFAPSGGGSVTGTPAMTDVNGIATVGSWTVQLGTNTLTATVAGSGIVGNPVVFGATGASRAYAIDVRYLTSVTPAQREAFDSAKARWERLIYGDVPDGLATFDPETCGPGTPAINETIDDVIIFVQLDSIDGPGKIAGRAGPCIIRPSFLPGVGVMQFDTADVATLLSVGLLNEVILHEMGHVLGYGTIWRPAPNGLGLIVDGGGPDPHFIGAQALAAFDRSGGASYSAGVKVPVENCVGLPPSIACGAGSRDVHWRETVFEAELMTGFFGGPEPLSVISTASMGDLGYTVNYAASDPYTVTNPLALRVRAQRPSIELGDDILRLPIIVVDASGRVVQVIQPRRD
ncbi:MAG TPA: Ig-like domain-containing protein [Gemmatimonadales bacterium]|nr:Ig-like domain-containing protein [Gemmatimonadales bacterium]